MDIKSSMKIDSMISIRRIELYSDKLPSIVRIRKEDRD